ncbi:MAG: PEP-CTERM sorting domain-containing protein [Kiritimatiellae bacterium]|nr:PEP-CTERM sorting domain-containing protein [Kiritimatiellia bacterium]
MKKMILALAVALVAGLTQAASLNWTISNIKSSSDSSAAGSGYIAYLFFTEGTGAFESYSFTTVDAVKTAIAGGTTTFDTSTAIKAYATTTANTSGGILNVATGISGLDNGDSVSGFAVVFDTDKKNYIVTKTASQSWTSATGAKALAFGSQASNTTYTAVPEPCSVALVLLGVAALGLKRKIA